MDKARLDPVATHLITSYVDTGSYSQRFKDDHHVPPSLMAKVHHLRSVIQALLVDDSNYELAPSYVDYGRVEFTDLKTGERYLLKSSKAVAIETATARQNGSLFPITNLIRPSDIKVIVYRFQRAGLELSIAPASTRGRSEKIHVADAPVLVDVWPYQTDELADQTKPFDQTARDNFADLGDLGHDQGVGEFE
ncbi:hypothetical protein [Nocardioides currus]|uniref:Uncharacterized protein n=1 Tax=Nocardioides currus TaxID=2133958 RepID=A0A2R7YXG4_9ACTN|nr:hypothetical protein [Nocardioides currus]PUA81055.1 hypothetical protein C7S10_11815 [Nocardioides currus]